MIYMTCWMFRNFWIFHRIFHGIFLYWRPPQQPSGPSKMPRGKSRSTQGGSCHSRPSTHLVTGNGKHTTYKFMLMTGGWCRWHCVYFFDSQNKTYKYSLLLLQFQVSPKYCAVIIIIIGIPWILMGLSDGNLLDRKIWIRRQEYSAN